MTPWLHPQSRGGEYLAHWYQKWQQTSLISNLMHITSVLVSVYLWLDPDCLWCRGRQNLSHPPAVSPRGLLAGDDAAAITRARARCHCLFQQVIVHHFLCWEDMRLPARQAFNLPHNTMAFEINRMKITWGVSLVQIWKLNLTCHLSFVMHCLAERGGDSSAKQKPPRTYPTLSESP